MKKGNRNFIFFLTLILSLVPLTPALSWDPGSTLLKGFMKVDGIPGESTDYQHKSWIEIFYYKGTIENPTDLLGGGGSSAAAAKFSPITIVKYLDNASPKLFQASASGKHIKQVTFDFVTQGGPGVPNIRIYQVKLSEVIISSITQEASGNPGYPFPLGLPHELISFSFGKIEWTYTQQKLPDGSGGGNVSASWDLIGGKPAVAAAEGVPQ